MNRPNIEEEMMVDLDIEEFEEEKVWDEEPITLFEEKSKESPPTEVKEEPKEDPKLKKEPKEKPQIDVNIDSEEKKDGSLSFDEFAKGVGMPEEVSNIQTKLPADIIAPFIRAKLGNGINLIRLSTGECQEIKGTVEVGQEGTFRIDNPTVSRHHATFTEKDGKLYVKDTSLNGTFIKGRRIPKEQVVEIHDDITEITLANERFRIEK